MAGLSGKSGAVDTGSEVLGMKNWSIDHTMNPLDDGDFQSDGIGEVVPGITQWSGSFDGNKDGAPQALTTSTTPITLTLKESDTAGQVWTGSAYITGVSSSVSFDGLVTYSYTFTGTGALTVATA